MRFQHLFAPFRLGHVTLRNRIVSTPHATRFGKDGYITERYIRYHQEKARGGAALVQCFGSASVHPSSPVLDWNGIKNWDDSSLPGFEAFARAIHAEGAHVMSQITHRGRRGFSGPGERPGSRYVATYSAYARSSSASASVASLAASDFTISRANESASAW